MIKEHKRKLQSFSRTIVVKLEWLGKWNSSLIGNLKCLLIIVRITSLPMLPLVATFEYNFFGIFSRPQFGSSAFLRLTQLLLAYSISITIHPRLTRQVQWSAVTVCLALLTNHHHLPLHHHHPAEYEDATGRCCRNYLMIMRASSYLTIITTSSVLLADGGASLLR